MRGSPVREHLLAMIEIVDTLTADRPEYREFVKAHHDHARQINQATAVDPLRNPVTRPPDDELREMLVYAFGHLVSSWYADSAHAADSADLAHEVMDTLGLNKTSIEVMEILAEHVYEKYTYTGRS